MWKKMHSKLYKNVTTEQVWSVLTDINKWADWQSDVEYCKMIGEFKKGNYFYLKPLGVKAVKVDLVEVESKKRLTDCTKFFGAKMYNTHAIEETKDGGSIK